MEKIKNLILGAGVSGLSLSHFIGHAGCLLLEQKAQIGGHCSSFKIGDTTWDEGPHVSFTGDKFVLDLFKEGAKGDYLELDISAANYWFGHWIPHPVQMYLSYLPEMVRKKCVESFLATRGRHALQNTVSNYSEWLDSHLGQGIKEYFVEKYTNKYWKCGTHELSVDWIGPRVKAPSEQEILKGATEQLTQKFHYVQKAIYPRQGGFQRFMGKIAEKANVIFDTKVKIVDLKRQEVITESGHIYPYDRLLSTIPLTYFVDSIRDAPEEVVKAAKRLACTSVSLVNLTTSLLPKVNYHWFYVYDDSMQSTRVTSQHLLSSENVPPNMYGYQVEVYCRQGTQHHPKKLMEALSKTYELSV